MPWNLNFSVSLLPKDSCLLDEWNAKMLLCCFRSCCISVSWRQWWALHPYEGVSWLQKLPWESYGYHCHLASNLHFQNHAKLIGVFPEGVSVGKQRTLLIEKMYCCLVRCADQKQRPPCDVLIRLCVGKGLSLMKRRLIGVVHIFKNFPNSPEWM